MPIYNILVVGVGGQGILTFSRLIGEAALIEGKNIMMSEIHGMAQRLGSVYVHVRIGDEEIHSPMIRRGNAHVLVALEMIEALRYCDYANSDSYVLVNDNLIPPPLVTAGLQKAPSRDEVIRALRQRFKRLIIVRALEEALRLGSPLLQNTVMLGVLASIPGFPLKADSMREAIKRVFAARPKVIDLNIRAFERGLELGRTLVREVG